MYINAKIRKLSLAAFLVVDFHLYYKNFPPFQYISSTKSLFIKNLWNFILFMYKINFLDDNN